MDEKDLLIKQLKKDGIVKVIYENGRYIIYKSGCKRLLNKEWIVGEIIDSYIVPVDLTEEYNFKNLSLNEIEDLIKTHSIFVDYIMFDFKNPIQDK